MDIDWKQQGDNTSFRDIETVAFVLEIGCEHFFGREPVSYTHLDVYKRQLYDGEDHVFQRRAPPGHRRPEEGRLRGDGAPLYL